MRSPRWHRDELILTLHLYFRTDPGQMHSKNPDIIKLSGILNSLSIHSNKGDFVKFRNPNGVGLKLCNFLAIDPDYHGKGMESYSKLDEAIFYEFRYDRVRLDKLVVEILKTIDGIALEQDVVEEYFDEGYVPANLLVEQEIEVFDNKYKVMENKKEINCQLCGFELDIGNYGICSNCNGNKTRCNLFWFKKIIGKILTWISNLIRKNEI